MTQNAQEQNPLASIGDKPILVLGRAGMDIYADPPNTKAEEADRFFACLGGSAGNIAAGLGRSGVAADLLTCVSDDAVGRFVQNQLNSYGVGGTHVHVLGGEARTSLAVTETRIEDTQTVIYRNGAADLLIAPEHVDAVDIAGFGGLIVTGTALAAEPSRSATLSLMKRAAEAGCVVILDIDYRAYSWTSPEQVANTYQAACIHCDMVVGNDEEFAVMQGSENGESFAQALADQGKISIYKRGPLGARSYAGYEVIETGIYRVEAIKPMGAGDAFMANLVAALINGHDLRASVLRGSAAAAMVVSGLGCAPAMPDPDQLSAFIADHPGPT